VLVQRERERERERLKQLYLLFVAHFHYRSGPNKWRQQLLPREILNGVCKRRRYGDPLFHSATKCTVNNQLYDLEEIGE